MRQNGKNNTDLYQIKCMHLLIVIRESSVQMRIKRGL